MFYFRMVFTIVIYKLKGLFLVFFGLVKRSLCCFKRRRRSSCDSVPLTGVGVEPTFETKKPSDNSDLHNWNTWDEPSSVVTELNSVQQHIEYYRQQQQALRRPVENQVEEEQKEDFFQDMAPRITKQTKVFVRPHGYDTDDEVSSRLAFAQEDAVLPLSGSELGTWEESRVTEGTWEEAEGWDVNGMVREKRRAERERRVAMKKNERETSRVTLGAKVS